MTRKPTKGRAGGEEPSTPSGPGGLEDLPERWSAQRKTELVLRLLRGEALDAVSRDSQVPAHELESWKRIFLEGGARGPKTRWSDAEIVTGIQAVLAASPFHGEGYRKIRARLAHRGLSVSGKRVLRLLRQHG